MSIDTEGRILKEDGTAIRGLYGAGECAAATFFYNEYPYSGSCIQYCLTPAGSPAQTRPRAVKRPERTRGEAFQLRLFPFASRPYTSNIFLTPNMELSTSQFWAKYWLIFQ